MDAAARRAESRQYRWRGDGLVHEVESIDYLHGLSDTGCQRAGDERDRRSEAGANAESRSNHWDLLEGGDAPSRTA